MQRLHVMVGLILDRDGRVLVARRPDHVHQGGLWEFPGGKLESGEAPLAGLRRELFEELAVEVIAARPWRSISHDYPDKAVLLDIWEVTHWQGTPRGAEQQPVRWMRVTELEPALFPAANAGIVLGLRQGLRRGS